MKSLKIDQLKLKNRLFLAPMVEVTDLPYRLICRKAGAGMAYIEMLYVDAITHENFKTRKLMETCKEDKPLGIQITGSNSDEIKKAVSMKVFDKYDLVDVNCGCPSVRITGNEAGSFLLKNPEKIAGMIKTLKNAGYTTTAKIRLGFKENNSIEVAKIIEKAGADALTVHARLAIQSGKIPADWNWIKKIKNEIGIPVIGNGDIINGNSASEMLDICDGVMVARAAMGDPYIFERISKYLKTGKEEEFDLKKNMKALKNYLSLCKKYEFNDIGRIKYVSGNFIRNFEGAAKQRSELMVKKSFDDLFNFVNTL